jgi:hypothetical protein
MYYNIMWNSWRNWNTNEKLIFFLKEINI